ncbi:MAG: sulfite exporter TauE/SafE family protein [Alphaproteobacteria bacterium]|nr:sulfite exporter TauE/SafE family protein [Alphaproteobacteria bacterium]
MLASGGGIALTAVALSPGEWAWAVFAILAASVLRGFTGFGFAVVAVPLASLVLPPQPVVAAALLMQAAIGARDCFAEAARADWRSVRRLTFGAALGTPLGLLALAALPIAWVRLGLGALVLGATFITWKPVRHRGPPARPWAVFAGFCSGLSNGLAAMSGPPAIVYFLAAENERARVRSSLMTYFPLASLLALPPAWYGGMLGVQALIIAGGGLPIMVAGGWVGTWLFRRYGQTAYRPTAILSLAATGFAAIARGAAGLLP